MLQNISCHIIGFNPYSKKEFISQLNNKIFNVVDLDVINYDILKDTVLDKMFQQYVKLKNNKNDKFKDLDKKMSLYWQQNFIDKVESNINQNKINILIGQNNHYKSINKRVNFNCTNKFLIKSDINEEVKSLIRYNLENHKDEIINGKFPLEYINFDYLHKKKLTIDATYKKFGYIEKNISQLKNIISLIEKSNNNYNIWISLREPYNVGSLIHPNKNNKIIGYSEPSFALLNSFNLTDAEIKRKFNGTEITIKEVKPKSINKLKTLRYLYLVESKSFVPHENGNNNKFFSQIPVKILNKKRINDVFDYLTNVK
jgi:hypothetical protein